MTKIGDVVYATAPYTYIWADNKGVHKQGKAFPNQQLIIKQVWQKSWYEIKPLELDRPVDVSKYPAYWVKQAEVMQAPTPVPLPVPDPVDDDDITISDEELASAIVVLLKWWKRG